MFVWSSTCWSAWSRPWSACGVRPCSGRTWRWTRSCRAAAAGRRPAGTLCWWCLPPAWACPLLRAGLYKSSHRAWRAGPSSWSPHPPLCRGRPGRARATASPGSAAGARAGASRHLWSPSSCPQSAANHRVSIALHQSGLSIALHQSQLTWCMKLCRNASSLWSPLTMEQGGAGSPPQGATPPAPHSTRPLRSSPSPAPSPRPQMCSACEQWSYLSTKQTCKSYCCVSVSKLVI